MYRTEDTFFDDHIDALLDVVYTRVAHIEDKPDLSAEDEMELAALDRISVLLEGA